MGSFADAMAKVRVVMGAVDNRFSLRLVGQAEEMARSVPFTATQIMSEVGEIAVAMALDGFSTDQIESAIRKPSTVGGIVTNLQAKRAAEGDKGPPDDALDTLLISLTASTKQMKIDVQKARRAMKRVIKRLKRAARER